MSNNENLDPEKTPAIDGHPDASRPKDEFPATAQPGEDVELLLENNAGAVHMVSDDNGSPEDQFKLVTSIPSNSDPIDDFAETSETTPAEIYVGNDQPEDEILISTEADDDLAMEGEDEDVTLREFERRRNVYKKGTFKWIKEEHAIVTEHVTFLEAEFRKLRNVLRVALSTYKSAREMENEKRAQLDELLQAQDSLNSWISERQNTYAWRLLSELNKERQKLIDFEKEIEAWANLQTEDLYEEARENKRRFLRKFRLSFGGFLLSLLLGYLVNLLLTFLGLGWLPIVLNFLGITNPISIISQLIGFGAVFSWFFAFIVYFRDYSKWRKRLNKEISDARFFLRAVTEFASEKGRLQYLHGEMTSFLALMAKLLHRPWSISERWIDFESSNLDSNKLPHGVDIAVPREVGAFNDVKNRALGYFISTDWRERQQIELIREYERLNSIKSSSIQDRVDEDPRIRRKLLSDLVTDESLASVGDIFVKDLASYIQKEVLPNETKFTVDSIKPNNLSGVKLSTALFDLDLKSDSWEDFVSEILGPAGSWQYLTFNNMGQKTDLYSSKGIKSYALVPERLSRNVSEDLRCFVVEKDDKAGVEVIVRVDVSTWIEADKVN